MRGGDTRKGITTDDCLDYYRLKPELPKHLLSITWTKSNQSGAILYIYTCTRMPIDTRGIVWEANVSPSIHVQTFLHNTFTHFYPENTVNPAHVQTQMQKTITELPAASFL